MQYQNLKDTIVALATPTGVGAIGVIRLSGSESIALCNRFFRGKDLATQPSHTIHFGTMRNERGEVLDEVLVSVFKNPTSYTGEDVIEISCHGSHFIQQQVIELMIRHGARSAERGEFTLRAFLNGKMDLSQAEAVADVIAAESEASHALALQQMRGGFSHEIAALREELIHFASLVELELDFSEEDVEFANRSELQALVARIQRVLRELIRSFQLGNVLKNGVSTVIAGRPNAGKSTLLNALLNEERAIVSDIAGTTRDTIEEVLNVEGIQFRLIDTAGIREATDAIEAIGVEKTLEKIAQSTLLLYVFDAAHLPLTDVQADLSRLQRPGLTTLLIANKVDLLTPTAWASLQDGLSANAVIGISAAQRLHIDAIRTALYDAVLTGKVSAEGTIVTNVRHYDALEKAHQSLAAVLEGMELGVTGDFLAQDIRHALAHLGTITGEISTDDLLGNIFSNFCIGK